MIQIIDYGAGNLKSVTCAIEKLGVNYQMIKFPEEISDSAKIIFPGVGAAGNAMNKLIESGFAVKIPQLRNPFLGICLGMQLLTKFSEENETTCLEIISGQTKRFPKSVKVPQIGWNRVKIKRDCALFQGITDDSYFYFVNSYYVDTPEKFVLGETSYGSNFAAAVRNMNFYGVQFHPEKSGDLGLKLLSNFCELC
ncbi:MAG: imidazole glycerol phosphate synthase subunit HisH [Candidatus Paceibacterota bacterium]|jgi:glutamine amidotransferase